MKRLVAALDSLIAFFDGVRIPGGGAEHWARHLGEIRHGLTDPKCCREALRELEQCFGGMGTLNDYVFHPQNQNIPVGKDARSLNDELERLLDQTYMEYRLLGGSIPTRLHWRWLAWRYRGAPPRVLNAFRRRTNGTA